MADKSWTWIDEARYRLSIAGLVTGTAVFALLMCLFNAFVLMMMWRWYVSSYFPLPPIDMIHAFGLTLIVDLFRKPEAPQESREKTEQTKHPMMTAVIVVVAGPLTTLLMGWIGSFWL